MPNKNFVQTVTVSLDASLVEVHLVDGRELAMPLDWFPRLAQANVTELRTYEVVRDGTAVTPVQRIPSTRGQLPTPIKAGRAIAAPRRRAH